MQLTKVDKATFCHEFGHVLTATLLYGVEIMERMEVIGTTERIDGHVYLKCYPDLTQEEFEMLKVGRNEEITGLQQRYKDLMKKVEDVRILFGGIVAENICGYTKVKMHRGTDAEKIKSIIPDKQQQMKIWREVYNLLEPHRNLLNALTDWGIEKVEWGDEVFSVCIHKTELKEKLERYEQTERGCNKQSANFGGY